MLRVEPCIEHERRLVLIHINTYNPSYKLIQRKSEIETVESERETVSIYLFCNSSFRDKLKSIILLSSIFIIDSSKHCRTDKW